jgi:hypothetical protein
LVSDTLHRIERQTGVNWNVAGTLAPALRSAASAGVGSGSDYAATADGTAELASAEGTWIELDVTEMVQGWVADAANNYGVVVLQAAASGYVIYDFCSELGLY